MKVSRHLRELTPRWYIWAALAAALSGFLLLLFWPSDIDADWGYHHLHISNPWILTTDQIDWPFAAYTVPLRETLQLKNHRSNFLDLVFLKLVIDHFPKYVLFPAVLVGFSGFSLDLLYKRLRKQDQGAA